MDVGVLRRTVGHPVAKFLLNFVQIPVRASATVGRALLMLRDILRFSVVDSLSLRLPLGELTVQAWTLLKITVTPAVLMAIPFGVMVSVQVAGLVSQVGATSLVGTASAVAVIRQGAPITAGLLMAGAASSAIASDLGSRSIREELDALRALSIDPVRHLVVPRFWALVFIAPMLCTIIMGTAVMASFLLGVFVSGVTPGTFWMSFGSFAKMVDVWFTLGKSIVFAAIVAVVSCLRGTEAKGGPRGVADAVNAAVVINVVCIALANLAITQLQTMFFPMEVA